MDQIEHQAKIIQTRRIRSDLKRDCAICVPNFMLSYSETFNTGFRSLSAADIFGNTYVATSIRHGIDIGVVAIALRSSIVNYLFDYVVHLAQSTNLGPNQRFSRIEHIQCKPEPPKNLEASIRFSHMDSYICHKSAESSSESKSAASSDESSLPTSLDPIMICGLRQIGKSHIMFHLAARMLAEVGVVVVYIGDAKSLVVDGSSGDYNKYARFVKYIAAAFTEYPKINKLVERWYFDTGFGQQSSKLHAKTSDLLCQVRKLCEEEPLGITPVFFIDSYESMTTDISSQTIVTAHELAHTYGFLVTLSTTLLFDPEPQSHIPMNLCALSMPLSESDAANVLLATHSNLRMARSTFRRLYDASDFHIYDFVELLHLCNVHPFVSAETAQRAIDGYYIRRRMRLTHMHAWFYTRQMNSVLDKTGKQAPVYYDQTDNIIRKSTPELRKEHQRIIGLPFMLYHNLDLQLDTVFDPQFISTATSSYSPDPTEHPDSNTETNRNGQKQSITCCPMAAIEAMYNLYFEGTVMWQFSWLLEKATYKIEIEPPVRARLFDLVFLETQWIDTKVTNPLTRETWKFKMSFSPVTGHNYREYPGARNPRNCQTFEKAVQYVAQYIKDTRGKQSLDMYNKTSNKEVRNTLILYLPDIKLSDWPDKSISADTSFVGSFMVAVTRVDIPSQPADKCRYEITWIASDPLRAISVDEKIEGLADTDVTCHGTVAENKLDGLQSSRDTRDFDRIYGYSQSWTAKAIRIFPTLKEMCQKAIPEDALHFVRMLTLTDTGRAESIFEQNQLITLESELTKSAYEKSRDIGTIKASDLKKVHELVKHYL